MKYFAVVMLALICAASANQVLNLSEEQKERIRGFATECREKEGVSKEEVQAVRGGTFQGASHAVKCVANCVLEKVGFIIDGAIQADVILTKLGPFAAEDKLKAVGEKCNSIHGADNCDTGFQLLECYYTNKAILL